MDPGRAGSVSLSRQSDPARTPGHPPRRGVSPALPPACALARVSEGALLRDLESDLPSSTRTGPGAPHAVPTGSHRAGAHHAGDTIGRFRSSADALSAVSDWDLDPGGHPRSAPDAGAMTVSSPDVARWSARGLAACVRPSASPRGYTGVRRVTIRERRPVRGRRHLRPHVQITEHFAPFPFRHTDAR